MPRMIRKYGKRAGASGNYNLRGSHSSDPSRVNEGMNLEHDITSTDTFSIDLYTMNTRYLSPPTWQDSLIDTNDPMLSKRKRPKSDASFGENERVDRENKRGEKWTEEEEALLRERRNGEPESWEETGRYFVGRTINALQKKWKLMALSDKMKMDPVLESNLMNAVAKHAPDFYRRLAAEMEMSEEQVEIIEDKVGSLDCKLSLSLNANGVNSQISILFLQGKLPLKSNPPILMPTYETPITQKACTAPSRLPKYYSDSYGDPAGNTGFQSGLCYPSYRLPSEALDSNSLLGFTSRWACMQFRFWREYALYIWRRRCCHGKGFGRHLRE